jgi:hypothetical protein
LFIMGSSEPEFSTRLLSFTTGRGIPLAQR